MLKKIMEGMTLLVGLFTSVEVRVASAKNDIAGSDTTEKVGMVVVAIVVVGLLAASVNRFMPGFFDSIFASAQAKLNGIFATVP